ncbi:hypothetical protein [Fimbriiglobus ruber]|uniref:TolA protein n=1 Tax=Fimbriiglobus ruber TaxID=1908690 RepID=A0A225D9N6_9BACT|nr:hypothetical protein [Fimbriiglobus ruber]OWK38320.1 TolA protein [Fimbriiglobus ruber]
MPFVLRPPTDAPPPLTERLAHLGLARRRAAVAAGVFRVAAIAVFAVTAACALDAAVHLPGEVRAAFLAALLVGVSIAVALWVRGPARESTHPLSVALLLERLFPRLNDALASAVEFLGTADGEATGSPRFRRVAVIRAENLAERYDFGKVVPSGRAWKAFWLAAVAGLVAAPLALADVTRAGRALVRLADPFGTHPYPTKTTIEILDPVRRHARGEPYTIKFVVRGVIPDRGRVIVQVPGGSSEDEVAIPEGDAAAGSAVSFTLDSGRTARDFAYRVVANDGETDWVQVAVAPAPKLVPLDGRPSPQIRAVYPAYTDLSSADLPDGTGVVEAVAGTQIHFRAAADQRISSASFHLQSDLGPLPTALACAPLAGANALSAYATSQLAAVPLTDIPVRVSGPDGTILEADFIPPLPGLYALRFTDEPVEGAGLTGTRLFDFRVFPDPSPVVILERPAHGKDALTLLPTTVLAVRARAEDRPFAVKTVGLEYRTGGPDAVARVISLTDLSTAVAVAPAVAGGPAILARAKPVGVDAVRSVPLAALVRPDGTPPVDGDVIVLRAIATDWDDRTALKEPGRSKEIEIRVRSRSSLEAQFQKELAAMRPELLRLKDEQREAREAVGEVAKAAAGGAQKPEDAAKLGTAEQAQRHVRNRIADPAEGLRAKAEELRQIARANNLPRSPVTEKVEATADDLGRIVDQHLDGAETPLAAGRQESEKPGPANAPDAKKLAELLTKANGHQKDAEDALAKLLERLEQWGGAGEVRGEARAAQDQLARATEQANKAADAVPAGRSPDQLSPDEKAKLDTPAGKLDQLAEQASGLLSKAGRLADQKDAAARTAAAAATAKKAEATRAKAAAEAMPPGLAADAAKAAADALAAEAEALQTAADRARTEAEALRKAVREAGGDALPQDVRRSAEELRQNRPGESAAAARAAADRLDKLTNELVEKPTETPDVLSKKPDATADEVDKLAAEQDELRKKTKAASEIADPEKRAKELNKLAREQEALRRKAEQLVQKLTRDRAEKPAEAVRKAAEQMDAARDALENGRPPDEQQAEALDRLDDALGKLDAEKKQDREQLSREQREQLAELLKAIRERQKAAVDEVARLQGEATKAKKWGRAQIASLGDLDDREKQLAEDLRAAATKQLAELPVFNKLATQAAAAMEKAAKAAAERKDDLLNADPTAKFDAEAETATDERLRRPMQLALRRLDQILDTLKEDPKAKPEQAAGGGNGGQGGENEGAAGGQGNQGGIPPLAQLKALRAMQAEVNERTVAFAKAHPNPDRLTDDERDELKELEQGQRDVAELFDKLASIFRTEPELP